MAWPITCAKIFPGTPCSCAHVALEVHFRLGPPVRFDRIQFRVASLVRRSDESMGDPHATRVTGNRAALTGLICTLLLSVVVTLAMAWPVVRAPRTMIFGREIAGRHHDPFTVMQQFETGGAAAPYRQPLTDEPGIWMARAVGPVAAYNLLVLLSFPLTAIAAYWLAQYLLGSPPGAMVAALAFTFAPVHLAQATYHVYIAQTQWLPLYLLALFSAIDRPTFWRGALLVAAVGGLVLANDYAGLIGALVSLVALPAYWIAHERARTWPSLLLPAAALAVAAAGAFVAIVVAMPELLTQPQHFAFPVEDIGRYGARWWAYWLPPVDHPLLGGITQWALGDNRFGPAILELQLWLGWSLTALAVFGVAVAGGRTSSRGRTDRAMLAVAAIAAWSFYGSLAPGPAGCVPESLAPPCLVYRIAPMFRAYARLGIMTALCVAILAGYAVARLLERPATGRLPGSLRGRCGVAGALVVAIIEFWPFTGRARDILPTAAHRWLADRPESVRALDCTPWTPADASLSWLMKKNVSLIGPPFEGCDEPDLAPKLAALGFSHVIARNPQLAPWAAETPVGLRLAATFPDGRVYTVSAVPSAILVLGIRGFSEWEQGNGDRWRWMGPQGWWTLLNPTTADVTVTLHLELESFAEPRQLVLELDGQPLSSLHVAVSRRKYVVGPITVPSGQHVVRFGALEPAARPIDLLGVQDRRFLTVAIHPWQWSMAPLE